MCLCVLTNNNRKYIETRMSTSAVLKMMLENERKKLKKEWEELPEPKPSWEQFKRYGKQAEEYLKRRKRMSDQQTK